MKKFLGVVLVTLFLATGSLLLMPNESQAVPAFARQTGQACISCHFNGNFPVLTSFGREFKAGGYTMVGGESLISGEALSLPVVLNAAVITKLRYTDGNKEWFPKAELDFPDEMALFFGGRVAENIGFLLELPIRGGGAYANLKVPFEFHAGSADISVVPFSTDGLGPFMGYELLNTGLVDAAKPLERSGSYTSGRFIGTDHPAEGITLAARNASYGYLAYTFWRPNQNNTLATNSFSSALRAVANTTSGDWYLAGGFMALFGKSNTDGVTDVPTKAWGLDAQAQGQVGNMPLGIYISYASANKSTADEVKNKVANMYNANPNNKTVLGFLAQLGVIPNKANLSLGGRFGKTGAATDDKDNAVVFGANYNYTQNVKFEINHEIYSGSANDAANHKHRTTLMMFAGF